MRYVFFHIATFLIFAISVYGVGFKGGDNNFGHGFKDYKSQNQVLKKNTFQNNRNLHKNSNQNQFFDNSFDDFFNQEKKVKTNKNTLNVNNKKNQIKPTQNSFKKPTKNITKKQIAENPPISTKNNSSTLNTLERVRRQWQNTPYVLGGTSRLRGADCSAFTQSVFREHFHTNLKRSTKEQMRGGKAIAFGKWKSGDLIFFKTGRGTSGYHVGIYTSGGNFLHLSSHGGAKIQNIYSNYWKRKYVGARRYLNF